MIKQMRPNFVLEIQPTFVDLGDDENDEDSCIVLEDSVAMDQSEIVVVDLDSTTEIKMETTSKSSAEEYLEHNMLDITKSKGPNLDVSQEEKSNIELTYSDSQVSDQRNHNLNSVVKADHSDSELEIIDLERSETANTLSVSKFEVKDEESCDVKNGAESDSESCRSICFIEQVDNSTTRPKELKWKRNSNCEEVFEETDNDVIILDDSLSSCNVSNQPTINSPKNVSSLQITVLNNSRSVTPKHSLNSSVFQNKCKKRKKKKKMLENQQNKKVKTVSNQLQPSSVKPTQEGTVVTTKTPKKSSKFSYKRIAHLVSPLTQVVLPSTQVESSSGSTNIYNPNANSREKRTGLRPIVIDGNNVAIGHGKGRFSLRGIQICINYFEKRGHRHIKAFLPHYTKNKETYDQINKMEKQGTVVITPSRKIDGKIIAPYDDRYIVQYAAEVGGIIVTLDNYRDLLTENTSWKETIENRLLMYSWVDDLLMFPQDPLGRKGPTLEDFLKFPD